MPMDESIFIALWNRKICMAQYNKNKDLFYVVFDICRYNTCWKINSENESKFTHWSSIELYPEEVAIEYCKNIKGKY